MTSTTQAASVMTKLFTVAVNGLDPTSICLTIIEDVAKAICSGIVNAIKEQNEFANPPSGVQFGNDIYIFYESGNNIYYGLWQYTPPSSGSGNGTGTWTTGIQISGVSTGTGPGAVVFNNTIYVFYQGLNSNNDNDGTLWYVTYNGTSWSSSATQVPAAAMSYSPSAAVFDNDLYVFYQGSGNDHKLYYTTYSNGAWSNSSTQNSSANMCNSPAATVYNGELYVFFQGVNNGTTDNNELWYVTYDGSNWANNVQVSESYVSLVGSPSAVVYNGQLCVIYVNSGYSNSIWYTPYNGSWSAGIALAPLGLSFSPSTAVFTPSGQTSPLLFYMCQGMYNDGSLWCNVYNGANWIATYPVEGSNTLSQAPGQVVFNNTLYCFYQGYASGSGGNTGNGQLWYVTSTDGSTWSDPTQVSGGFVTNSPAPVVFNSKLYVFYQYGGQGDYLYYSSSSNGTDWDGPVRVGPCVADMWNSPAPVVFNNTLYVFFMGSSNNSVIWYATMNTSGDWCSSCTSVSGANTCDSPSAVVYGNNIYLFYNADDNDGALLYQTYDGSSWNNCGILNDVGEQAKMMSNSPSAAVLGSTIYVFYQAENEDQWGGGGNGQVGYFYSSSPSPGAWNQTAPQIPTSPQSPAGIVASLNQDEWNAICAAIPD
jgi:hypothetical protein